jgi:hypothetical protein
MVEAPPVRPFPWFGWRERAAARAVEGEPVAKPSEEGCVFCDRAVETDSLPNGRVRVTITVCTDHVQLAARRALAKRFADLATGLRASLEDA